MVDPQIFIPGGAEQVELPLSRYLPPIPAGVIAAWLEANVPQGAWLLEPFGAAPLAAVEAARAGYRVAVAANNPIARFLLEMQAQAPQEEAMRAALADLGAARRGDERLEPHILGLYQTECPECGAQTSASAFIWEREATSPLAKIIDCQACGFKGESPTNEEDQARAAAFQRGGPHQARALERIAPSDDPDRVHAEEALGAYLPRAVYALFTIINRLDGLTVSPEKRRLLSALVLSACDRANTLWAHPSGRLRPKQLSTPPQFREYNLWLGIEQAVGLWAQERQAVPIVAWPEVPPESGGISLFEGRLRDMAVDSAGQDFQAVVTAFPRPNQAFWTLSALWAGWLWGREAIGPFALVLRRRRYDWAWHSEALYASLNRLAEQLPADVPLFGLIAESEPGLNAAALIGANLAGFRIEGLSLRREEALMQVQWRYADQNAASRQAEKNEDQVEATVQALLAERGEPTHFLHVQAASLQRLAELPALGSQTRDPGDLYTETRATLEVGLTFRRGFLRFGGSESSPESGQWWLLDAKGARDPLADRLEIALVRTLLRNPGLSTVEIDAQLCAVFSGLLTPPRDLLLACLNSYGEEQEGRWGIRAADLPRARRADLREIHQALAGIGERLGYTVTGEGSIEWRSPDGSLRHRFFVIASAVVGALLLGNHDTAEMNLLVLPGGRSHLVLQKLKRDPRLAQAVEDGWGFVKFRHVRRLAENQSLTPESFEELLALDPLSGDETQAPLL